jgi:hypothetical protein
MEELGLRVLALLVVEQRQAVEAIGHVRMASAVVTLARVAQKTKKRSFTIKRSGQGLRLHADSFESTQSSRVSGSRARTMSACLVYYPQGLARPLLLARLRRLRMRRRPFG